MAALTVSTSLLPWGALNSENGGDFFPEGSTLVSSVFRPLSEFKRGLRVTCERRPGETHDLQHFTTAEDEEERRTVTLSSICPPPFSS